MGEKSYSILALNWESIREDAKHHRMTFDYGGKLFIKTYEPFMFIGTVTITKETTILYEELHLTSRFQNTFEKEKQLLYQTIVMKEAEKKALDYIQRRKAAINTNHR